MASSGKTATYTVYCKVFYVETKEKNKKGNPITRRIEHRKMLLNDTATFLDRFASLQVSQSDFRSLRSQAACKPAKDTRLIHRRIISTLERTFNRAVVIVNVGRRSVPRFTTSARIRPARLRNAGNHANRVRRRLDLAAALLKITDLNNVSGRLFLASLFLVQ